MIFPLNLLYHAGNYDQVFIKVKECIIIPEPSGHLKE